MFKFASPSGRLYYADWAGILVTNPTKIKEISFASIWLLSPFILIASFIKSNSAGALDATLYSNIQNFISHSINTFMNNTISHVLLVTSFVGLAVMIIWIWSEGYLIVTGRSRESMSSFCGKALRAFLIVTIATGVAATPAFCVKSLTLDLNDSISNIISGSSAAAKCLNNGMTPNGVNETSNQSGPLSILNGSACNIQTSFMLAQAIIGATSKIDVSDDPEAKAEKNSASWFLGIGTAGPALVAGTMLIVYQFAIALFVGLGPIFIMCLLWSKTAHLFSKWLMYGISTMFSNAMLAVVSTIVLKLSIIVAAASLGPDVVQAIINGITNFFINSSPTAPDAAQNVVFAGTGLVHQAMTVGGIGLMLSTLVLVIPPMAGRFFSETLGSMSPYSVFGGVGAWGGTKGGGGYDPATGGYKDAGRDNQQGNKGRTDHVMSSSGTPPDPTHATKTVQSVNSLGGTNQNSGVNSRVQKNTGSYDHYIKTAAGNPPAASNQPPNPITPVNKD